MASSCKGRQLMNVKNELANLKNVLIIGLIRLEVGYGPRYRNFLNETKSEYCVVVQRAIFSRRACRGKVER